MVAPAAETGAARHWATHGSDTNYVFGVTSGPDGLGPPNVETSCPFEPDEASLSRTIMTYWANFAATGYPNVAPSAAAAPVKWPRFGDDAADGKRPTQMLWSESDGGVGPASELHAADCAFWAGLWQREANATSTRLS